MIDEYLEERENKIKLEKLLAWKDFYEQCNNEWECKKIQRQIDRL